MSRILAVGDIHGCSRALDSLLELVAPREEDTLVFLGDYIDRGPDACGVLERLIALSRRENFVALCGNHDVWMMRARSDKRWFRSWLGLGVGGMDTLLSYGTKNLDEIPALHWAFLDSLLNFYETEHFLFAHAAVEGHLTLPLMSEDALLWRRVTDSQPHFSGKTLICGHTAQHDGVPLDLGHAICIDTYAYGGGWLSCLDPDALYLWQANQAGEVREGELMDFVL
ncbi:MAG TPA: metallophosphoesterase family protein [Abditibacterium sp.]|jgi:serine/threonine protein phosphatase 1